MWNSFRRHRSSEALGGALTPIGVPSHPGPKSLILRLLCWGWWRRGRTTQSPSQTPKDKGASVLHFVDAKYIFGLDWRMIPPARRLSRALAMARKEGQFWYVSSELGDVTGFLKQPKWLRGRHYAASLHLAARYSQGGLELFVFVFPDNRYAVLALQESRPLSGMDQLTDEAAAQAMVEEFLAIQRGQPIRLVGNTSWLEGQETLLPEDIFAEPARSAKLRSLHSGRVVGRLSILVLLAAGAYVFGSEYLEDQRRETLMELQNSPTYQQKIYNQGLAHAWSQVGPEANVVLQTWYGLLSQLPLYHHGWGLQRIECEISQCKAHWLREFGSYEDFLKHLPVGAYGIDESQSNQESVTSKIVTVHPLAFEKNTEFVKAQELKNERSAQRHLGDLFQDFQLLGKANVLIEPAVLFGGDQNLEVLKDAVLSGKWSLRHQLWLLPAISLPPFVRAQNLLVELRPEPKEKIPGATPTPLQAAVPQFELTGAYYAKN